MLGLVKLKSPKSHEELLEYYDYRIRIAAKNGTMRAVLIKMIDNHPDYQYLQKETTEYRILYYMKTGMRCGISLDDLKYTIEKCNIQVPQLLHASVETHRNDIFEYLLNSNRDYYLHKDYKTDVDLVLSAVNYNTSMVHKLIYDYKIDIWNPPTHIDKTEHFSYIWRTVIGLYKANSVEKINFASYGVRKDRINFIKFFVDHGANINTWFYGYGWTYNKEYCDPEYFIHYSPLTYAIGAGQFNVARYLISYGAHLNDPVFSTAFAAVKYGLCSKPQEVMIYIYNEIEKYDTKWIMRKTNGSLYMRENLLFVIQHGADYQMKNDKGQDIYQSVDDFMYFDIDKYKKSGLIHTNQKRSENFWKWHGETVTYIKDIVRTAISDASNILKSNRKIVAKSMYMVMKLMVMSGKIRSNQILSGNILSVVMDFHGGISDPLNTETLQLDPGSLSGLEILLEKRQFLLSYKLSHKKHYEKLGFLEKKGGILCQKEGNLGQKKCDLPVMDVRNEQNMGICTEEVCKNVQKTIKNSTFLNNLDADSISMIEAHLNMQHHNVRSVAFNTMSAMLDDTLIAQAEWYVREGRALNTFAAAVANGGVTVISGPSATNEAVRIAEIAVSPDSEMSLGRESTSHITVIDEAPNDDIITHSDDILSQAMDLIHNLHFDTALTTALTSTTPYAL